MMSTNLSRYIKQERIKHGLNAAQLSHMMGYKNINKGMRRIIDLERDVEVHTEVLKNAIEALELDKDIVEELIQQDEAVDYAKSYAKENQKMLWLVLSRRENIHIGADGEVMARYEVTGDFINLPYADVR